MLTRLFVLSSAVLVHASSNTQANQPAARATPPRAFAAAHVVPPVVGEGQSRTAKMAAMLKQVSPVVAATCAFALVSGQLNHGISVQSIEECLGFAAVGSLSPEHFPLLTTAKLASFLHLLPGFTFRHLAVLYLLNSGINFARKNNRADAILDKAEAITKSSSKLIYNAATAAARGAGAIGRRLI